MADWSKIKEIAQKYKNAKYLSQLTPAAAVLLLAVFGFSQSTPLFEAIDWTTAQAVEVSDTADTAADEAKTEEQAVGDYTDGTYTGTGVGFHGEVKMKVTVEDKQITAVDSVSNSDDAAYFNRAMTLVDSILREQTWEVDSVSGATYSSRGIKEAVENALTGAKSSSSPGDGSAGGSGADGTGAAAGGGSTGSTPFTEPSSYKDGTYTGSAQGYGGTVTVTVTISGGKITAVEASGPNETPSYWAKAKTLTGTIVSKQSPNVDAVSGATYSSNGILNATKNALRKAAGSAQGDTGGKKDDKKDEDKKKPEKILGVWVKNKSSEVLDGTYKDGTYTGSGEGYGGTIKVTVVIKNNQMTKIKVTSAKGETGAANASVTYQANGRSMTFGKTYKKLLARILKAQSGEVDAVTGATFSSEGLMEAVQNALAKAKQEEPDDPQPPQKDDEQEDKPGGEEQGDDKPEDGGEEQTPEDDTPKSEFKDGTYKASAKVNPDEDYEFDAYSLTLTVTIADGKISAISNPPTITDTSNSAYNRRAAKMIPTIVANQSADVDAISGATCSSTAIREAVNSALAQARAAQGG